jgi:parallel beta-helix repeat protein
MINRIDYLIQSTIPAVYDDSLSYYELLSKVIAKMNEVTDSQNELLGTDFKQYVADKLTSWISDGTLDTIINQNVFNGLSGKVDSITKTPSTFNFTAGADNTTNIQNALSNSSHFKFPKGIYNILLNTIEITQPIVIEGEGEQSTLNILSNQQANGTRLHFKDIDGIVIRNIRITDSNQVLGRYNVYGALSFENCQNILLDNVTVENTNGAGIHGINCENVTIQNCKVLNTKADGIHFQRGSRNVKLINNLVTGNADDCLAFISHDYQTYGNCDGFEAYGNRLGSNITTGSGVCTDGSKNIKIHDNVIIDTLLSGIRINPITENGQTQTAYPSNIEVYNNTIWTTGLSNLSGDKAGITVSQSNYISVKDNNITSGKGGIFVTGCEGEIEIKDNLMREITDRALWVTTKPIKNTYARVVVEDNIGYNVDNDGIYIEGQELKALLTSVKRNILQKINKLNSNGKYGVYINNMGVVFYEGNILMSDNTVNNFVSGDTVIRKGNYPLDTADNNYVGSSKHNYGGSAPANGVGAMGDVCWNWNPSTGVLCWVNNGTTWQPVNIN